MATYLEQSLVKLQQFEGSVPWMYRDTRGNVTVGVGLMLAELAAAQRLPFLLGDRPASASEIAVEFHRVDHLPMGRPSLFYRREGGPELAQETIAHLLRGVLLEFEAALRERIAGYDGLPDGAKMALLDMAYNLGPAALLREYPKLLQAIANGAWAQAATCCSRLGPGAARNEWTRQMFLESVVSTIRAEGEGALKRFGYGVLGLVATIVGRFRPSK